MDRLSRNGSVKKNGVIIVRVEAVTESNMAAKFKMKWSNVNNVTKGCLGMCSAKKQYRFTIERLVFGTKNQFVVANKSALQLDGEVSAPKVEFHYLTDICNNNKEAPIKFGIVTESGKEINAVITTINELEGGKRDFEGKAGA